VRNHLESRSVISFRPPSTSGRGQYSRLEEERPTSRVSSIHRVQNRSSMPAGDDAYSTIDRSVSRMSRRSIGPPRPPPPKSRPESRIDTSDLSQLGTTFETKFIEDPKVTDAELSRAIPAETITEMPDAEVTEQAEEAKRLLLLDHARQILEDDMKRRLQQKNYRQSLATSELGTDESRPYEMVKGNNPFGTPRMEPKTEISKPEVKKANPVDTIPPTIIPPPPFLRKQEKCKLVPDDQLTVDSQSSAISHRLHIGGSPDAQASIDTLDEILYKAETES